MDVRMIRYGFVAGFGLLLAVCVLEWITRPGGTGSRTGTGEADITEEVWQVLAEARKILEESQ